MLNRVPELKAHSSVNQKYNYGSSTFDVPVMSQSALTLTPRPYSINKLSYQSRIIDDLHTVWDLDKFTMARAPVEVLKLCDTQAFVQPVARILDMPIKLAGSNDYRLPDNLAPFLSTIQQIIDHEHSILTAEQLLHYHAYLTIDQSEVRAGCMQRKPGAHVDGFQGARISPKTFINHSYVVANGTPTVFYPQAFDFTQLDERFHNFFLEMDRQAIEENAIRTQAYTVYLMDAYTVHRADIADKDCYRTFLRISYDVKEFDRLGNTRNPALFYAWEMVPREAQSTLSRYQPLTDTETAMILSGETDALARHAEALKKTDPEHFYNLACAILKSGNVAMVRIMLASLETDRPSIPDLRLIFIAAASNNAEIAIHGKDTLCRCLKPAQACNKSHLFLDFLLEMITQEPFLLPKILVSELIKGQEQTPQGKEIRRAMLKVPDAIRYEQNIPLSSLWHHRRAAPATELPNSTPRLTTRL